MFKSRGWGPAINIEIITMKLRISFLNQQRPDLSLFVLTGNESYEGMLSLIDHKSIINSYGDCLPPNVKHKCVNSIISVMS